MTEIADWRTGEIVTNSKSYMETLAQRLLGTGRWSWCIGVPSLDGWLVYDVQSNGHVEWVEIDTGEVTFSIAQCCRRMPDLAAAAALGHIEHALIPAAWPGCAITVLRWTAEDGEVLADVHVFDRDASCAQRVAVLDTPLAEALIAALEAAP